MNRCKCRRKISQGSLQFSKDISAGIQTVFKKSQKVRRVSVLATAKSILHLVKSMAGRVKIFSGKKCSFLKMIQKTLLEVSAVKKRYSVLRKQTLMVDVMEYLMCRQLSIPSYAGRVLVSLHSRSLIVASDCQEEERD